MKVKRVPIALVCLLAFGYSKVEAAILFNCTLEAAEPYSPKRRAEVEMSRAMLDCERIKLANKKMD